MLGNAHIIPMIAVADLDRARAFYGDVLGLHEARTYPGYAVFGDDDGRRIDLYQKDGAKPADSTRATFEVMDLEREIADLQARGADFSEVDLPGAKRKGIITTFDDGSRMAWLKDPEGNWLGLYESGSAMPARISDIEQPEAPL